MSETNHLLVKPFRDSIIENGFTWFDDGKPYKLNILGIRNLHQKLDRFNDLMIVAARGNDGLWFLKMYDITTLPGKKETLLPSNPKGVAILVPGQYTSWMIGKHKGKYPALTQHLGEVSVYRDSNRDMNFDYDPETIDKGYFGINIHKAKDETDVIGGWSAGCQVFKYASDFNEFMQLCEKSKDLYGNKFTYTLLTSKML